MAELTGVAVLVGVDSGLLPSGYAPEPGKYNILFRKEELSPGEAMKAACDGMPEEFFTVVSQPVYDSVFFGVGREAYQPHGSGKAEPFAPAASVMLLSGLWHQTELGIEYYNILFNGALYSDSEQVLAARKEGQGRAEGMLEIPVRLYEAVFWGLTVMPGGTVRREVRPGTVVYVAQKPNYASRILTRGVVDRLLTSAANHPRGVKVFLTNGVKGRVQLIAKPFEAAGAAGQR